MPRKPPAPPPEELVDPDQFDDLEEDAFPDDLDLQDLEPVFTEEAPIPVFDDDEDGDDDLPLLEEDAILGDEAPIELYDPEGDDALELGEELLDDTVDWHELTGDQGTTELPTLAWTQQVHVEELGRTLLAELDPTSESTTWFRPDITTPAHPLSFELGGQAVSTFPSLVRARRERLRIGRDVLSGRFLVRC